MARVRRKLVSPRKQRLRKLLNTEIKFAKIPEDERDTFLAAETEKRINAAFELYDIDPSTPETAKWLTLAIYLLGEHFKGCRSLARHPGGAPGNPPSAYSEPISDFDKYCATAPQGSQIALAGWFLKSRGGSIQVGNESINNAKSFLNMYRRQKKAAL